MKSIAVIGAGWYGCHVALTFKRLGFQVVVYEKASSVLSGASAHNQFRLHQGFHYARHHGTRVQSWEGFQRFVEHYPDLSSEVSQNVYAVPKQTSVIDFMTYKSIMMSTGLQFRETQEDFGLTNIDGCILTYERVINTEVARKFFMDELEGKILLDTPYSPCDADYVVDATWGTYEKVPGTFFEPTVLFYYTADHNHPAITLVDGCLNSIYPTEVPGLFTLSSVQHTPLGTSHDYETACQMKADFESSYDAQLLKRCLMEREISQYVPDFREKFQFVGVQTSMKTKLHGAYDNRSCYVKRKGNIFSVMSGKIDTIFHATDKIIDSIVRKP